MKSRRFSLVLMLAGIAGSAVLAGWPAHVTTVAIEKGKTVTVAGALEKGIAMPDLSWASSSANACFPGTQNLKFRGNHVLFATVLPVRSILTIKVIPDDPAVNLSLYAYSTGTDNYSVVPALASCVSCEADHKWDRPKRGKTQDHTRSVELDALDSPYNVVVGVAGADGLAAGSFKLEFKLE